MAKRKNKMQVQIDDETARKVEAEKARTGATHARIVNRRLQASYEQEEKTAQQ